MTSDYVETLVIASFMITYFIIWYKWHSEIPPIRVCYDYNQLFKCVVADAKHLMKDRDHTHGLEHVMRVYELAKKIRWNGGDQLDKLILKVAILHDVYDHKYPNGPENKEYVKETYGDEVADVIDHISFSTETKYHIKDPNISIELSRMRWLNGLSKDALIARNIVSDADKLEAIGLAGLRRCRDFIIHNHKMRNEETELSGEEIMIKMREHYNEKLKILYQYYIVTPKGREMGAILDTEMKVFFQNADHGHHYY